MGIFNNFIDKKINKAINELTSRKTFEPTNKNSKKQNFFIKAIGLINNAPIGRDTLAAPEYNFDEIRRAIETDSYIKITLDKHSRLIYKAGYYMKSENEEALNYLKTRFRLMSYMTGKPIDILYQEIADDIVKYSNVILVKKRERQSLNGVRANGLFGQDPIVGYFRIDPSTVYISRDDYGNITKYVQKVDSGKEKTYKKEDIIHIYMDKESSNSFGTPKVVAALEDVRLLRKLEGYALAIVYRFAMPLYHFKVGKTEQGFQATDKEIDDTKYEIEHMSLDGAFVTNEKTEISVIGSDNNALNLTGYLTYFENRVFSALDSSASMMGRGGAKQDADSMEAQSHDYVKYVQKVISIFIENMILNELLLEGGFNPILNDNDIVQYVFNEINLDTKIKVENHEMLKYQSNLQGLSETRRNIGYKETVDEEDLYKNKIEVPAELKITQFTAECQADASIKVAKATPNVSSGNSSNSNTSKNSGSKSKTGTLSNGKKSSHSPNKDVSTRNRPVNQNGVTSAKVKENLNETYDLNTFNFNEKVIRNKLTHKKEYKNFYDKYEIFKDNVMQTDSDIDYLIAVTKDSMNVELRELIKKASKEGVNLSLKDVAKINKDINIDELSVTTISLNVFYEKVNEDLKNIFSDIKQRLDSNKSNKIAEEVFNALEYRFRYLIEYILPKAKWYSYLIIGKAAGVKLADVNFNGSKDEELYDNLVKLNAFSLDMIPSFHPFCDCTLKLKKNEV